MKNQDLVERIIEFSKSNTAGYLLSDDGIKTILRVCEKDSDINFIEKLISDNQTDAGYTVKASDFLAALQGTEKEEPKIHRKRFHQFIDHEFTDTEILEFSKNLSKTLNEIDEVDSRKKSAVSQFKSEIDKLISEVKELANKINTGSEERNVRCESETLYDENIKRIVRLDTGEIIWAGAIPEHERQAEMYDKDEEEKVKTVEVPGGELSLIENPQFSENTTTDEQSSDTEPDTTEKDQSDGEDVQTEESQDKTPTEDNETIQENFKQKVIKETQAKLDAEDAKIAEEVAENLSEEKGDLPKLPNQ